MSRLTWTDPAPSEVERPRLPWWTLLPRKLLLATAPITAVVVVVMILMFTARRIWRYPLFLIGGTILTSLGLGYSWWALVWLAAGRAVARGQSYSRRQAYEKPGSTAPGTTWHFTCRSYVVQAPEVLGELELLDSSLDTARWHVRRSPGRLGLRRYM